MIHIINMIFIAREEQLAMYGRREGKGRLEKWENGTEKMEVFGKRPEKEKRSETRVPSREGHVD